MELSTKNLCITIFLLLSSMSYGATTNLFREYIGADLSGIKFTDVPINPNVEFHFILSFTIDYTKDNKPAPTDGKFDTFWYTQHLGPADVSAIKSQRKNVKVAVSLGGDLVANNQYAYFEPKSIASWVKNAITTLTQIIKMYGLDGIDIDYEHFHSDPNTFAECIGQLITTLKKERVISFASIAPFDEPEVKSHYMALWRKYGHAIDYVNYQFYAFDKMKTADEFVGLFDQQTSNYKGGKLLASFATDNNEGGLPPDDRFFDACAQLKKQGKLGGIFVWSADDSKKLNFGPEKKCQRLLAMA